MKFDYKVLFKKEVGAFALVFLIVIVYILFFKANPPVRVDWNKIQINKSNSTLSLGAPTEVSGVGKEFKVTVDLDTHGYFVNAAQSYIEYDPRVLEVVKTDTSQSFCKFYPENNVSNEKGIIKLACGSPYPGFRGKNTLQTIQFLAKAIKTTQIKISRQSMVLANDGKGTNLLKDFDTATINIKAGL